MRFLLSPATDAAGDPAAPDDAVSFDFGTDPTQTPLPAGTAAGAVASTLTGSFAGSLRFSQDNSGFGTPGTVELGFGAIALSASGIDLVDAAAPGSCGDPALVRTDGPIALTAAPGSTGEVGLLGGTFSLDLHLSAALRTETRTACSDPFTTTGLMDGIGRPPLPLRIDGSFRISPALTADGRLRLGRMVLSGPQHDSHVELHGCTAPTPDPCALAGDGALSGALSASAFSAELLVGGGA